MARTVLDVFLSSTAMDLAAHRTAVHERLMRAGAPRSDDCRLNGRLARAGTAI